MARLPAAPTRPSRGPWLAIGFCCPGGSSLTTASSAPLDSSPPLMDSRRRLLHPRLSAWGGNPEVPQFYSAGLCARVPPPIPRWPRRVHMTVASSSVLAFTPMSRVRQPHRSFRGSEFVPTQIRAPTTARELGSSPHHHAHHILSLVLAGSPRANVEYDYVGKQCILTTYFHPSPTALWAAGHWMIPKTAVMNIRRAIPEDREVLLDIWLRSVRATHTFPSQEEGHPVISADRTAALTESQIWVLCSKLDRRSASWVCWRTRWRPCSLLRSSVVAGAEGG